MKKILVCGAAGFLMSNLIRYMSYRTKEYEFVSVDNLISPDYYKLVYVNRNHKFYIGNVTDKYFMDRLIQVENPDIIINGIGCNPGHSVLDLYNTHCLSLAILSTYNIPIISLSYPEGILDGGIFRSNFGLVLKNNGIIIEVPNCFGFRQKTNFGFAKILKETMEDKMCLSLTSEQLPWTYAEDVSSYIWFMIEQKSFGNRGEVVSVPPLGYISTEEIANIIEEVLVKKVFRTPGELWNPVVKDYKYKKHSSWEPDSKDLKEMIRKTIQWYNVNKWILKIGV